MRMLQSVVVAMALAFTTLNIGLAALNAISAMLAYLSSGSFPQMNIFAAVVCFCCAIFCGVMAAVTSVTLKE